MPKIKPLNMPKIDDSGRGEEIFNPEKIVRKNAHKTSVLESGRASPIKHGNYGGLLVVSVFAKN